MTSRAWPSMFLRDHIELRQTHHMTRSPSAASREPTVLLFTSDSDGRHARTRTLALPSDWSRRSAALNSKPRVSDYLAVVRWTRSLDVRHCCMDREKRVCPSSWWSLSSRCRQRHSAFDQPTRSAWRSKKHHCHKNIATVRRWALRIDSTSSERKKLSEMWRRVPSDARFQNFLDTISPSLPVYRCRTTEKKRRRRCIVTDRQTAWQTRRKPCAIDRGWQWQVRVSSLSSIAEHYIGYSGWTSVHLRCAVRLKGLWPRRDQWHGRVRSSGSVLNLDSYISWSDEQANIYRYSKSIQQSE